MLSLLHLESREVQRQKSGHSTNLSCALSGGRNLPAPHAPWRRAKFLSFFPCVALPRPAESREVPLVFASAHKRKKGHCRCGKQPPAATASTDLYSLRSARSWARRSCPTKTRPARLSRLVGFFGFGIAAGAAASPAPSASPSASETAPESASWPNLHTSTKPRLGSR